MSAIQAGSDVEGPGAVTVSELRRRAEQAAVAFEATGDSHWTETAERYRAAAIARHRQDDEHSGACCPECGAPGDLDRTRGAEPPVEVYECPFEGCDTDEYSFDPKLKGVGSA